MKVSEKKISERGFRANVPNTAVTDTLTIALPISQYIGEEIKFGVIVFTSFMKDRCWLPLFGYTCLFRPLELYLHLLTI